MDKPIVVGISGSAGSQHALVWAVQRASRHGLPVTVVHAVDDRWMTPEFQYEQLVRDSAVDLLQRAQDTARGLAADVKVDVELRHGSVGAALREASKEASMVVVGAHDKHWMDGGPLTDRALQIVSASDSPVVVVPASAGTGDQGIVVGVDGSEDALQAVRFAAAEADRDGDELTVVLAFRSPARRFETQLPARGLTESIIEEQRVVLSESVAGLGNMYPDLTVHQRLETDMEPAKALVDIAGGARLLVIGSRGRAGFSRLVRGSTAHAVLLHVPCPTIVTRLRRFPHED
jgi:nucleotide-binding universal stress UspA family protein